MSDTFPWAQALADRYVVQRELGRGGMAVVYLARDLRHDRDVALKVLRPELSVVLGRDRFSREIQLMARLQHPHILPVFDSGESAGHLWYVMPFIEGETLRARLTREGRLPVEVSIDVAREVGSALAYAHEQGVIHRDIKPENILLSRQGQALVADFGIAKALSVDDALTETGLALGTPSYMPPEQVLGERPVRPQADVYAMGVVLYEMLTGSRPFADATATAMLARRLTDGAPPVTDKRPEVPVAVARLVHTTLEVDPGRRPADGAAFAAQLQEASGRMAAVPAMRFRQDGWRRHGWWGLVAVAVVAAGATALLRRPAGAGDGASIGVLPFENRSGDTLQAYLAEGMSDEIAAHLSAVPELRVAPRSATVRYRGSTERPEVIARQLGVTYLLTGGVLRQGDSVRLSVELVDAPGRRQRWSSVHAGPARSLSGVVDSVSRAVTLTLVPSAAGGGVRTGSETKDSLAFDYYLLAQHHWNRFTAPDLSRALAYSDSAIARDGVFVGAWLARANALLSLASGNGAATTRAVLGPLREAVDTILVLDPRSAEAHSIRGLMYTWLDLDWAAADREFRLALALGPTDALCYTRAAFLQMVQGHTDSALTLLAVARKLEPANTRAAAAQALAQYYGRDYAGALAASERTLQLDPYFPPGLVYQVLSLSGLGRHAEAIAVARQASATTPHPSVARALAIVLARGDSLDAAREVAAGLERRAQGEPAMSGYLYAIYAVMGDPDRAFQWLQRAVEDRSWFVGFLRVDPVLDPIRADPRFQAALLRAGFPADPAAP